ncbi:L domain-like protein [Aulographum hederae CBS 113979]|uniref:L domain-like protein n=1 Tax=Aulographum hederae CBS 113979 TaxID=1176131 RepID=A0A6G1H1E3_9PEZI|nr:L domain-like protein [Aulographum hederae CBS 113979]
MEPSPPSKPPGVPPRSRLPVLRSTQVNATYQGRVRPVGSVDGLRNSTLGSKSSRPSLNGLFSARSQQYVPHHQRATNSSISKRSDIVPEKDDAVFKKPAGRTSRQTNARPSRPPSSTSTVASTKPTSTTEDEVGSLDGFRTASRSASQASSRHQQDFEIFDEEPAVQEKKKPRPSLSDRTVESLANIPSSPAMGNRRRRSSFFAAQSPMGPPSRPASAMSSSSRPTTRDGPASRNPFQKPATPSQKSQWAPPKVISNPTGRPSGHRSSSIATPRANTALRRPAAPSSAVKAGPGSTPKATPQSAIKSKTMVVRGSKSRPGLAGAFDKPMATPPTSKKIDPEEPSDSAKKASASSAALREQIRQAKAAKRRESDRPVQMPSAESAGAFDFDLEKDPFNQVKQPGVIRRRVDAARSDGKLNISALNLKEVPEEVMSMYNYDANAASSVTWSEVVDLVRFNAAENELETIPDELFPNIDPRSLSINDDSKACEIGGIESLDLHGNLLRSIPIGLRHLERLTVLNLSRNKIDNAGFDVITKITCLKELRLAENALTGELPSSVGLLQNLEILELQGNALQSLPEAMKSLVSLRVLNISHNQITMLPMESLASLPLVELRAIKNGLAGALFPSSVAGMKYLQRLDVSINDITKIKESGDLDMPALLSLNVSANRLTALPRLSGFRSLTTIIADENHISVLPIGFTSLQSLKTVNLNSNDIKRLDERMALMDSLENLSIAGNPLTAKKYLTMTTEDIKNDLKARLVDSDPLLSSMGMP